MRDAVRRDERRAERDGHRHRGGQVHRAGGAGASASSSATRAATATLRAQRARSRRATCRRCCWRSRWSAPSCTASVCSTSGQLSVGGLVAYIGLMGMLRFPPHLDLHLLLVQLGRRRRRAHPGAACARRPSWTRTRAATAATMRGEIVFDHVTFSYGDDADPARMSRSAPRRAQTSPSSARPARARAR